MSGKVYYDKKFTMFHETLKLLGFMLTKELVDLVTFQKLNAELYKYEFWHEQCFVMEFLKFLYILCENKPYFEPRLNVKWFEAYIKDNKKKIVDSDYKYCLDIYRKFKIRKKEYEKEENVEKRREEREKRLKEEAEKNERLRPRIEYDIMRQSEGGIIFPDI